MLLTCLLVSALLYIPYMTSAGSCCCRRKCIVRPIKNIVPTSSPLLMCPKPPPCPTQAPIECKKECPEPPPPPPCPSPPPCPTSATCEQCPACPEPAATLSCPQCPVLPSPPPPPPCPTALPCPISEPYKECPPCPEPPPLSCPPCEVSPTCPPPPPPPPPCPTVTSCPTPALCRECPACPQPPLPPPCPTVPNCPTPAPCGECPPCPQPPSPPPCPQCPSCQTEVKPATIPETTPIPLSEPVESCMPTTEASTDCDFCHGCTTKSKCNVKYTRMRKRNKVFKHTRWAKREIGLEDHETTASVDPTCNSVKLKNIMFTAITTSIGDSKKAIQKSAEAEFGLKFNVVCSESMFSYVAHTNIFCQATVEKVYCYAFSF